VRGEFVDDVCGMKEASEREVDSNRETFAGIALNGSTWNSFERFYLE
jgi:hypothetical protein